MNVLSIGNSFSQDAHRYIHQIARADGYDLKTTNLYISGCPLSTHFRNIISEAKDYGLESNGVITGFKVSLKEALLNREWDVVTVQQASGKSVDYDAYQPYLNELVAYVRKCVPKAKIAVHQTWAYEQGCPKLERMGYSDQKEMFCDLQKAYENAKNEIGADIFIPSGELLQKLLENGITRIHRDTYHLSCGISRYAVGLLWYKILSGNSVKENTFCDFDEEVTKEEIEIIKKCVEEMK